MSLRAYLLCSLLIFVGCSGSEDDPGGAARDADAGPADKLAFASPTGTLLPNGEIELSVSYLNELGMPEADVLVDFSLVGAAAGASLSPTQVATGEDGVATTTLRAGSTATDLKIRARVGDALSIYLPLTVRPALGTILTVGVRYQGARKIASYTVTSLPMSCAQALSSGLAGDSTYQFSAPNLQASFDVGYGLSTAVVGWGKDDTGGKLASGCTSFMAPITEDAAAAKSVLTVELKDIDLTLSSPLALQMELNASPAVRHFSEASARALPTVVAAGADADYLLDAVQKTLSAPNATALAARRTTQALAASLQPVLVAKKAGPTAYGSALGQELARRGASLVVDWSLRGEELAGITAQSADGGHTLALTSLPVASIVTRFTPEAAELSVDQLVIALGLGSYGRTLLAGVSAADRAELAGCEGTFASWWSKSALTDLAPAASAQAACAASLAALDTAIGAELAKLDLTGLALQLAGEVSVHDRDGDGQVDDLGPGDLTGSWGSDAIQAVLQSPQRTAFQ